ncbi:MAG: TonB-dependent receptor [Acidobacteria bacterium]|nr:TonB-dependent receptor [Acidobacteriota bacterium]MCA1650642.1 TonB-dependent receptor [Acidobacteriota bacterium]
MIRIEVKGMMNASVAAAVVTACLTFGTPAAAQVFAGRVDVTVEDVKGVRLSDVTLEITGPQTQETITDAQGLAHLLNLAPGSYELKASKKGFSDYILQNVRVRAGASVPLRITMNIAGEIRQVDVWVVTPVVDPFLYTTSTTISRNELENNPTSRDVRALLQTVPGVTVDRVNTAGARAGQGTEVFSKGAEIRDDLWFTDGSPVSEIPLSSPPSFDIAMFEEGQITTGGAGAQLATAGVHVNTVLRSGANKARGTARVAFAGDHLQSRNVPDSLSAGGAAGGGNRTERDVNGGFELGAPLVNDSWWAWGSYSKTDVRSLALNDAAERTTLDSLAATTQAQLNAALRAGAQFLLGNTDGDGRGAGPLRSSASTVSEDAESRLAAADVSYAAGGGLFLTARGAYAKTALTLEPAGGRDRQVFIDTNGVYHNTNRYLVTDRPQRSVRADGNWFRGRQEVAFGVSWRRVEDDSVDGYGNGWLNIELDPGARQVLAIPVRPYAQRNRADYSAAYVAHTLSWTRLTTTLAIRLDRSTSSALESSQVAHPTLPLVLPAVNAPAVRDAVTWNTVSPRVGASYLIGEGATMLVRAGYAMFPGLLDVTTAGTISASSRTAAYYLATNRNSNFSTELDELTRQIGVIGTNPANPLAPVNQIDPDLKAPRAHEVTLGAEREIWASFGVVATLTWRRFNDVLWRPVIGVTRADYVEGGRVTGNQPGIGAFEQPFYVLPAGRAPLGGGRTTSNREGYHRTFKGAELVATKAFGESWMARLGVSWNDDREHFDDATTSIQDPTPMPGGPLRSGGIVVREALGDPLAQRYLTTPKYQAFLNWFYQAPRGVHVGFNLFVRDGFGKPYHAANVFTGDPASPVKHVLIRDDLDDRRLPAVATFDLRVGKSLSLGPGKVMVDVDVFNLFDRGAVLERQYDVQATGPTGYDTILEIMHPRIVRVGVRVKF